MRLFPNIFFCNKNANHDNSRYGYKIIPADELLPERSDSFEVGTCGHHGDFAFTAAVFYNDYKNFINIRLVETIGFGNGTTVDVQQYHNADQVTIKGAELNLTYFVGDAITIFANTAYQDGKDRTTGNYIREISPLSGTVGLEYQQDSWGCDVLVRWSDGMRKVNEGETTTSSCGAVDLTAYYEVNEQQKVNFALTNLLDRQYTDYLRISGTHKDGFSAYDADYRLSAGRKFSLSVKYTF